MNIYKSFPSFYDVFNHLLTNDGKIGYTYVTFNPKLTTKDSHTFDESGNSIYKIDILGIAHNPNTEDNINKILESIKFFD